MSSKKRVRLSKKTIEVWKPEWEPKVRLWAFKYIRNNKWRCESIHSINDLMQDAYLIFLKISDAYPRVVEPAHFMSLYKTSLKNAITDKSREYFRKSELIAENVELTTSNLTPFVDHSQAISYNAGQFYALINSGPPELKMLLDFMRDEKLVAELRQPQRTEKGQPRMTFDQRVSQLLGINTFPFRNTLKQLLGKTNVYM